MTHTHTHTHTLSERSLNKWQHDDRHINENFAWHVPKKLLRLLTTEKRKEGRKEGRKEERKKERKKEKIKKLENNSQKPVCLIQLQYRSIQPTPFAACERSVKSKAKRSQWQDIKFVCFERLHERHLQSSLQSLHWECREDRRDTVKKKKHKNNNNLEKGVFRFSVFSWLTLTENCSEVYGRPSV